MVEFQIELFEASTRCKTGFRTKTLDRLLVAFIAFFVRAQESLYTLAKTLFRILIPLGESLKSQFWNVPGFGLLPPQLFGCYDFSPWEYTLGTKCKRPCMLVPFIT